jgi:hypothetical protein
MKCRAILTVVMCLLVFTTANAQTKVGEPSKKEKCSWDDFPPAKFPEAPKQIPKADKARQAAIDLLAKKRRPFIDPLKGARFYGLCEIGSVKPSKDGKFLVRARQCKDIAEVDGPANEWVGKRWIQRWVEWEVDEARALRLTKGMRMNAVGQVVDITIGDHKDLVHGGATGNDQVFTIHLTDVKN